jgi:23S rRNA pseudouridine2605 synthase
VQKKTHQKNQKIHTGRRPGHVPLERALSKLGIASRTQASKWILAGLVRVNGVIRKDPLFSVFPEKAKIEIDGQIQEKIERRSFLLHKPRGVITTRSDEKGRPTVFSLIKEELAHLVAVGRLDWATSGLLILTNNTRLSAWLTEPSNEVQRIYLVSVRGEVTEEVLGRLQKGIKDQGEILEADKVVLRKSSGKESHLTIHLSEGKNREIRRMFDAVGHEVLRLKRVGYGKLELGELQPGEYRELFNAEMKIAFPGAPLE